MKGLAIFGAVVMLIAMTLVWCIVEHLLHKPKDDGKKKDKVKLFAYTGSNGLARSLFIGLVSALVMFFSGRIGGALWLAPAFFVVMVLIDLYLGYRFVGPDDEDPGGENLTEILWFTVMALLVYWAMRPAAVAFATLVRSAFWGAIIRAFPFWLWLATVLFFIGDALYYRYAYPQNEEDRKSKKASKVLFYIFFALALLALIMGIFIPAYKNWDERPIIGTVGVEIARPGSTPPPTATPAPTPTPAPVQILNPDPDDGEEGEFVLTNDDWYYLRHWDVIGGDKADDDNFGKNPLDEILSEKVAVGELTIKDISGKTEKELYGLVTFEELFDKFVEELEKDPVKGAAVMGYYDVLRGSNYLGSFSTELMDHKDALMEKINEKALEWLQDQDAYIKVLTAFVVALERSDEAEITYAASGLDDQMYMFGLTPDHVPIVVVMESTNHSGWFLTFRDYIKGTFEITVSYRVDCDFQPTNVSKVAPVTVQPNPNKPPVTGGGTPSPSPSPTPITGGGNPPDPDPYYPPTPTPPPTPPITNPKDPTKGTQVGPNTGNGPGPNTNNGTGATQSKAEQPTNSMHENIADYWDNVEDLKEPTKVAGDPNTPSTVVVSITQPTPTQDNNGNSGTGSGGADKLTPTTPDVTYQDPKTGATKSLDNESAGDEWEIGT